MSSTMRSLVGRLNPPTLEVVLIVVVWAAISIAMSAALEPATREPDALAYDAIETVGGRVAWEVGALGLPVVPLMSMFLVGRESAPRRRADALSCFSQRWWDAIPPQPPRVAGVNLLLGALVSLFSLELTCPRPGQSRSVLQSPE